MRSPEVGGVGLLGAGRCKLVSAFVVALVLVVMVCVYVSVSVCLRADVFCVGGSCGTK